MVAGGPSMGWRDFLPAAVAEARINQPAFIVDNRSHSYSNSVIDPWGIGMYVCVCNGVTDRQIREVAEAGCASVAELTMRTGAGAGCGSCLDMAEELLATARKARFAISLPVLELAAA